jgi:hypothetical protein
MLKKRYLTEAIANDLNQKMVFIGGPRQVGKTTFAKEIIGSLYNHSSYYNWDYRPNRREIINSVWPAEADLIILDEVHKYNKWKRLVKGLYDTQKEKFKIIVTGSARLDVFRRGGDSLQGRYHYYRLHPFSLAELLRIENQIKPGTALSFTEKAEASSLTKDLLHWGGFPEPLLAKDETILRRWQNERTERLFREDIRDTTAVRELGSMELLAGILPEKAAGQLSINSLREDLEVSHRAVSNWINLLERFYYHFRIYPFTSRKIRSLKKEAKLYLWDWSEIKDESRRFENLIASHLLKFVHYLHDSEGYNLELQYLRDVEGREVDFLITFNQKPWLAIEVKTQETSISKNLKYFGDRLNIPYLFQVILTPNLDKQIGNARLISADKFLTGLV